LIDEGLAIGDSLAAWPSLARLGFGRILVAQAYPDSAVAASLPAEVPSRVCTFPEKATVERSVLLPAVDQLDRWRRQRLGVFVVGPAQDFFAVTAVCVWLMRSRG
jgi:hypothetical protein